MNPDLECDTSAQFTIEELGWTASEAAETRGRLLTFAGDWDDPSMDVYVAIAAATPTTAGQSIQVIALQPD